MRYVVRPVQWPTRAEVKIRNTKKELHCLMDIAAFSLDERLENYKTRSLQRLALLRIELPQFIVKSNESNDFIHSNQRL